MNGAQQMQFSMLNEISKVAAIKATSALSIMLEFPIGVDIIPVETKTLNQIKTLMKPKERVVGLSVPILGSLSGTCLLIYPENSALAICDAMFHRKDGETKSFAEMEVSALTEAANIVIGNFLTSFAMPLQIESLMHRNANFDNIEFYNFMEEVSEAITANLRDGIVVEIAFHFQHVKIHGIAIFLFDKKEVFDAINKVNA
jgi:flagellar motor switch protein FliM